MNSPAVLDKFPGRAQYFSDMEATRKASSINFLRAGWWVIHLAAISLIYLFGQAFWR